VEIGERLASPATKVQQQKATIQTEEATKCAFAMPFISLVLGYDVYDPNEVIPAFTTDVGTKTGEKKAIELVLEQADVFAGGVTG
jgi:hypothetical protein